MIIKSKLSKLPLRYDGKLFSLSHTAVNKSFKHAKDEIGLGDDNITPYSLRHTHTSFLLSKAIPIEYISKRLGHANIEITWRVYSYLLEKLKSEEDDKLDNVLNF